MFAQKQLACFLNLSRTAPGKKKKPQHMERKHDAQLTKTYNRRIKSTARTKEVISSSKYTSKCTLDVCSKHVFFGRSVLNSKICKDTNRIKLNDTKRQKILKNYIQHQITSVNQTPLFI